MLWPLVQPLCLFAIYGLLFGSVLGLRMPLTEEWGIAVDWGYGLWLWTGALVWACISEVCSRSVSCIVDQRGIVRKLAFPSELLPLQAVLSSTLTLAIGGSAFFVASALALERTPGRELLWVPLILLLQTLFLYGLALLLAACQVFLRDTQQLLVVLLTLAMFATPIFWVPSTAVLPEITPWMPFIEANPLHQWMNAWRCVLLPGAPAECFTSGVAGSLRIFAPWALAAFLVGFAVFTAGQDQFADEI